MLIKGENMLNNQDFTRERQLYIGGSDIGAILGLSPYRTAVDVWLEKIGAPSESANSLPLRFGSFAEEFIAREYALETGYTVSSHESAFIHPEFSFFRAHVDRLVFDAIPPPQSYLIQKERGVNEGHAQSHTVDPAMDDPLDDIFPKSPLPADLVLNSPDPSRAKRILECKTANPFAQSTWGDTRTDQIPLAYLCQCAWYMAMTQIEVTDLAVLFGNSDFRIYTISRDLELEHLLLEKAKYFWSEYVQKNIPPPTQSAKTPRVLRPQKAKQNQP
jgi:putative phage-type endonuclease